MCITKSCFLFSSGCNQLRNNSKELIYPIVTTLKCVLLQMNTGLSTCMLNTLKCKYISSTIIHLTLQTKKWGWNIPVISNGICDEYYCYIIVILTVVMFFKTYLFLWLICCFFFSRANSIWSLWCPSHRKIPDQAHILVPRKSIDTFSFPLAI